LWFSLQGSCYNQQYTQNVARCSREQTRETPDASYDHSGASNTDSCVPLHGAEKVVHNYSCKEAAPGNLAFRWLYVSNVALNCDSRIQAVQYNEDTYILRQNVHWEALFTYLLFGNRGALLIDAGATPEAHLPNGYLNLSHENLRVSAASDFR
jgi:hypothetical protein